MRAHTLPPPERVQVLAGGLGLGEAQRSLGAAHPGWVEKWISFAVEKPDVTYVWALWPHWGNGSAPQSCAPCTPSDGHHPVDAHSVHSLPCPPAPIQSFLDYSVIVCPALQLSPSTRPESISLRGNKGGACPRPPSALPWKTPGPPPPGRLPAPLPWSPCPGAPQPLPWSPHPLLWPPRPLPWSPCPLTLVPPNPTLVSLPLVSPPPALVSSAFCLAWPLLAS